MKEEVTTTITEIQRTVKNNYEYLYGKKFDRQPGQNVQISRNI